MATSFKYTIDHYRAEGVSFEEFRRFFEDVHLKHALPLFKKYGITRYAAHFTDQDLANDFEAKLQQMRPGWTVSRADVVLEYWMPDLSCLFNVIADPEWEEKAVKGQEKFIDMSRGTSNVGVETTYLEGGEIKS